MPRRENTQSKIKRGCRVQTATGTFFVFSASLSSLVPAHFAHTFYILIILKIHFILSNGASSGFFLWIFQTLHFRDFFFKRIVHHEIKIRTLMSFQTCMRQKTSECLLCFTKERNSYRIGTLGWVNCQIYKNDSFKAKLAVLLRLSRTAPQMVAADIDSFVTNYLALLTSNY